MDAHSAWRVFLAGILGHAYARANYQVRQVGPILAVRFPNQHAGTTIFFDEYFADQQTPAHVMATLASDQHLAEHYITVLSTDQEGWNAHSLPAYRLHATERLMVRSLTNLPTSPSSEAVQIVSDETQANWLNEHDPDETNWITPINLTDPYMTYAFIARDGRPVARGATMRCDDALYVSSIHTHADYRRQGLAQALVLRLLSEGVAMGATTSVLTSSVVGEALYRRLGYQALGTLLIYAPAEPAE